MNLAATKPWQLTESVAQLAAGPLGANIDLLQPTDGLHELSWQDVSLSGKLFGVAVSEQRDRVSELSTAGIDKYVRGDDLVANYPQCATQPFTLHMYWRVVEADLNRVILDCIVSLQTSLLECFPKAILTTKLAASEAWSVSGDGTPPKKLDEKTESTEPVGVLLRAADRGWSYLEVTHPDDLGKWEVASSGRTTMKRELGGEFQEKGVIRRLRVRGAFLAAENDLHAAAQIIQDFVVSPPPLTA